MCLVTVVRIWLVRLKFVWAMPPCKLFVGAFAPPVLPPPPGSYAYVQQQHKEFLLLNWLSSILGKHVQRREI